MNGSCRTWIHQQFILDDLANATMSSGLSALASTFQSGKRVQYTSEEWTVVEQWLTKPWVLERLSLITKISKLNISLLKISHPHPFAKYLRVIILHLLGHWDRWNKCSPILQTLVHITSCASPTYSCVPVSFFPCCQHIHAHTHTCILYSIRQTGAKPLKSSAE